MPPNRDNIERNIAQVRRHIAAAAERAGRKAHTVRIIPVTKAVGVDEIRILYDLGFREFGENRVDDARPKVLALDGPIQWHMIGNVQRRKAGDVVELFDYVDSLDRLELAEALEWRCERAGKSIHVLIEVNVSGEPTKHGFSLYEVPGALEQISRLDHLSVDGLMTMTPLVEDPDETRPFFEVLRQLGEELGLKELSMGVTNDYEVAVEEGATQVRIGTALFA